MSRYNDGSYKSYAVGLYQWKILLYVFLLNVVSLKICAFSFSLPPVRTEYTPYALVPP